MAQDDNLNACGCCEGLQQKTPEKITNRPSQQSITYRVGTHPKFKASMLTALSSAEHPALLKLGTRDNDDFSIAYIDGVATMLDVLSFYQERYINEHYLNTSEERQSVLQMARLIGYKLSPGVAAATHLAFKLQEIPGVAIDQVDPITIPSGTRVQSVPAQDEVPQIFETSEDIEARSQWNAVAAQTTFDYVPRHGDLDVYIQGVANNVEVGDVILIVGQHRKNNPGSERWDVRSIKQVEIDEENQRTRLIWDVPLGHVRPRIRPSDTDVNLYVFRKRTSLFGHNAPDPNLLSANNDNKLSILTYVDSSTKERKWKKFNIVNGNIDLASPESKVVAGSWIALVSNYGSRGTADLPGYTELYRVSSVAERSRSSYGLSGKITRIVPDTTENINEFKLRSTLVLAQSELLPIHPRVIHHPVYGDTIRLQNLVEALNPGQYLSISGKAQRLRVAPGVTNLTLNNDDTSVALSEGDSIILTGVPEKKISGNALQLSPIEFGALINNKNSRVQLIIHATDRDGTQGTVESFASDWQWDSYDEDDDSIAEIAQIDDTANAIVNTRNRTIITLVNDIKNIYQRDSVTINFNVAPANNGESVNEVLGDGDARLSDQSFTLKQSPLTYVSADTPSGASAALEVRVNNLLWHEVDSLYQASENARLYEVKNNDDGTSTIQFGDGVEGGRLPSGKTNIRAEYRKYIGAAANLARNKLTTLLQKPLGVSEVSNPEASSGGADPELIDDAKQNAPLTVLTLDRAVSEQDYQHYARAFSGVSKAHALWIDAGPSRGIYITIAGTDGAEIPSNSSTYINLSNSLRRYGDPLLPLTLVNYNAAYFNLGLAVKVNQDAERESVLLELEQTLRDYYSFARRDFGQHISQDEVLAVAHGVNYIEAVRITRFNKTGTAIISNSLPAIIASHLPIASLTIAPSPAELITLSDEPIEMGSFT